MESWAAIWTMGVTLRGSIISDVGATTSLGEMLGEGAHGACFLLMHMGRRVNLPGGTKLGHRAL